jgi:hypothetical protein
LDMVFPIFTQLVRAGSTRMDVPALAF